MDSPQNLDQIQQPNQQNVIYSRESVKSGPPMVQPDFNASLPDLEGSQGNTDWVHY